MTTNESRAVRAGRIIKTVTLSQNPMMDAVAVKLNNTLNYHEEKAAQLWEKAFQLADEGMSPVEGALRLLNIKIPGKGEQT